jgi:hypothetical protein
MPRRRPPMGSFAFRAPREHIEAAKRASEVKGDDLAEVFRLFLARYAREELRAARAAKPDTEETP